MDSIPESSKTHLNVPYNERWELLKDVIVGLYIDKSKKLPEIVETMKNGYQFYASEPQYKRQFKIWNIAKALPAKKKNKIIKRLETRGQEGKPSMLDTPGKGDTVQKLRRYMKEQSRRDLLLGPRMCSGFPSIENISGHALQCGSKVFMNWNVSAEVLKFIKTRTRHDHNSPSLPAESPMSGVIVTTPGPTSSPAAIGSVPTVQSTTTGIELSTLTESVKATRAILFLQGQHSELFRGMNLNEQLATTDWMHQFWLFSFRTARTWGRGPPSWDWASLSLNGLFAADSNSLPNTPATNPISPGRHSRVVGGFILPNPGILCHWSIHYREINFLCVKEDPVHTEVTSDPGREDTWRPWTSTRNVHDFADDLARNLESNGFSNIKTSELPVSVGQIIKAAKRSQEQLLEEAFGFSIMARNELLVCDMLEYISSSKNFAFEGLFPLHLAASYLNGANTCCNIFSLLMTDMSSGHIHVRKLYTNHLGHTVLDNIMISILKSHTSCSPALVDEAFKKEYRFAGEEVDICGRWDADSDCVRVLQGQGNPTIPRDWKHMFCHTSVQAITHCIGTLFSPHWAPDINTPSGIFVKRCPNETCGMKLQPKPLHTLIITSVYLAQLGSEGENLFGMLACLLCLLAKGASPLLTANLSLNALLNDSTGTGTECSHSEVDPLQLAQQVPPHIVKLWPQERKVGWELICAVLKLSQGEWAPRQPPIQPQVTVSDNFQTIYGDFLSDSIEDDLGNTSNLDEGSEDAIGNNDHEIDTDGELPVDCEQHNEYTSYQRNFFRNNKTLATLWAAVQTELLTYRRISAFDPWISANFDMESALQSIKYDRPLAVRLATDDMMKEFCRCGVFHDSEDVACLRVEEASKFYFSNLEDWNRTTYLRGEENRHEMWGN